MYPVDGTLLTGSPGNKLYTVQGGVPVAYTGSDVFPSTSVVDQVAIDHAGEPGPFMHLK